MPKDDRLTILLEQFDAAWEMLDARLCDTPPFRGEDVRINTLTDDEYFWEPAPDCWSLRPRGEARGTEPVGKGEWVLDGGKPADAPPPFTTIAWRMCHLAMWPLMRYDYTFGSHSLTLDDIEWPGTAEAAYRFLKDSHRWRDALETVTAEGLDTVGFSQMPHGLDPHVRFVDLVAWTNLEFAHHAAEIACLRDLYRAQAASPSA